MVNFLMGGNTKKIEQVLLQQLQQYKSNLEGKAQINCLTSDQQYILNKFSISYQSTIISRKTY